MPQILFSGAQWYRATEEANTVLCLRIHLILHNSQELSFAYNLFFPDSGGGLSFKIKFVLKNIH